MKRNHTVLGLVLCITSWAEKILRSGGLACVGVPLAFASASLAHTVSFDPATDVATLRRSISPHQVGPPVRLYNSTMNQAQPPARPRQEAGSAWLRINPFNLR